MLSQAEADRLLVMPKRLRVVQKLDASHGADYRRDVDAIDGSETFLLDVAIGAKTAKLKYQTRGRTAIILARLDVRGVPHTNPRLAGGARLGRTHLHVYREGFDSRVAIPVDRNAFSDLDDFALTLVQFCAFAHIAGEPGSQGSMAAAS